MIGKVVAKQGVWGDHMRIITPILYKRVTCATCVNYCKGDVECSYLKRANGVFKKTGERIQNLAIFNS